MWKLASKQLNGPPFGPVPSAEMLVMPMFGARHPLSSRCLVRTRDRRNPARVFEFMSTHQAFFLVTVMARVLGVSDRASRLASPTAFGARHCRCCIAEADPHNPHQFARDLRRTTRSR